MPVRRIVRKDATLYRQAVVANLSNNLLLGPLIYCGGVNLFAARETPSSAESLAVGVCMTLGHAVGEPLPFAVSLLMYRRAS